MTSMEKGDSRSPDDHELGGGASSPDCSSDELFEQPTSQPDDDYELDPEGK